MWVNLHKLPAGKSMYTLYLTWDPKGTPRDEVCAEEVDVVAPSRASWKQVYAAAEEEIRRDYNPDARLLGVVDQSAGSIIYDAFQEGEA